MRVTDLLHSGLVELAVADSNYSLLYLSDGRKVLVSYHLAKVAELAGLIKVNRSVAVNPQCSELEGDQVLVRDQQFKPSRRKLEAVKMALA